MAKNSERNLEKRWRSKVTQGLRVKIPKDIVEMYKVKNGDIVEWIYDGKGNIKIEIKEIVLKGKKAKAEKAKVEKVRETDVSDAGVGPQVAPYGKQEIQQGSKE